ncbi:MAG: sulfite exporter TauE/SafE family protein [Alphaproteobacteria bacterium]|nr:sulfite exporter TauE/SafE family protein [Alphaproteobacteria bacterium]
MDFVHAINPGYSASGFAIGLLVGLTGVGGGSLMTPVLVLIFGIHPATAVGTDLLYASVTKTVGTLVHGFNDTVDWRVAGRLASGSIPATAMTLLVLHRFGIATETASVVISGVLGAALILTAITLIFRNQLLALAAIHVGALEDRRVARLTVMIGAVIGSLVTLSSVGAGALGVTALVFLYPKLPAARIVGSDIAHAVGLTLVAGIGHWLLGSVDWLLLNALLLGSLPGIIIGSTLSARIPEKVLRPLLAATLVIVGTKLVA